MSELELAAMRLGKALADMRSATECNMPDKLIYALSQEIIWAEEDIRWQAEVLYANNFDGAE